jgi:SpoVK/Ycf46/Vps4 family AAA+-type ATPase
MATADQLKALLRSHADGDDRHFYSVAMQMAAHEARQGHGKLAEEMRELIDTAKAKRGGAVELSGASVGGPAAVPITRPKGELASLLAVSYPARRLTDMVLSADVSERLTRVLAEQRHMTKLRTHGLQPRRKLLLVGPSGTGKTMTASALAGELGIPLFVVRLDALITKFMGETAAKLRQVFDAVQATRGVYFFDEFDAIGSQRGLANDVGEARRILNSFLLMIEQDDSTSVIVAATNHAEILDPALFRRFDDVVEYHLPTPEEAAELLRFRLATYLRSIKSWRAAADACAGLTHADITRAADDAIKDAVMNDRAEVTPAALQVQIQRRQVTRQRTMTLQRA